MATKHRRRRRLPDEPWNALWAGDAQQWNTWRAAHPDVRPDLRGIEFPEPGGGFLRGFDFRDADLRGIRLIGADLAYADLRRAKLDDASFDRSLLFEVDCRGTRFGSVSLKRTELRRANLTGCRTGIGARFDGADLRDAVLKEARMEFAHFDGAYLVGADFSGADLRNASFERADLTRATLDGAILRNVNLERAILVETSLCGADLRNAKAVDALVRGIHRDDETDERGVMGATRLFFAGKTPDLAVSRVDDVLAASLLSLLIEPGAVSALINAGSKNVVLLLGRFSPKRMPVLRLLADVLRTKDKIPIIFDFAGPDDRELSDTVRLLATLSEFVIVDLSDPRSVPLELQATVPGLMVPVVPIVEEGKQVFAMFQDLQRRYFWVLPPVSYQGKADLAAHVEAAILRPVKSMQRQIARRREELFSEPPPVASFGPPEELDGPIDFVT